jgi:HNH endonuclease
MLVCTKCGGMRFNGWNRCMDCRNARAVVRNERMLKNGGTHTAREWELLLATSPNCAECDRPWSQIQPRPDPRYRHVWTKGHKISVRDGGTGDVANLQAECYECNFRKNARSSQKLVRV